MTRIRNRIKELRVKRGLTQAELAAKAGVAAKTILYLEKGKYNPSLMLARKVAKALNSSVDRVFIDDGVWEAMESWKIAAQQEASLSERVASMRATGLTYAEIGRKLGVSKQRVFAVLKGLPGLAPRADPEPSPRIERMLTTHDVASMLSIHENTVRRWSDAGKLESHRIGPRGDRRYEMRSVDRLLRHTLHGPLET